MNGEQPPEQQAKEEESAAREAEETGEQQTGGHPVSLNSREKMTTVEIGFNCSGGL
jgi:hypothetical protein